MRSTNVRVVFGLASFWWRDIGSFGGMFFELSRACEVAGGRAPEGVAGPVDVAANGLVGILAGVEGRRTSSDFRVLKPARRDGCPWSA